MTRFSIRDLLWLTVVAALGVSLWMTNRISNRLYTKLDAAENKVVLFEQLNRKLQVSLNKEQAARFRAELDARTNALVAQSLEKAIEKNGDELKKAYEQIRDLLRRNPRKRPSAPRNPSESE